MNTTTEFEETTLTMDEVRQLIPECLMDEIPDEAWACTSFGGDFSHHEFFTPDPASIHKRKEDPEVEQCVADGKKKRVQGHFSSLVEPMEEGGESESK